MTFPYTAWTSYVWTRNDDGFFIYISCATRFAKKVDGAWVVVDVAAHGDHRWDGATYAQNYGSTFLCLVSIYGEAQLTYLSEDGGDTWNEITNDFDINDEILWLDCWQGCWLALGEWADGEGGFWQGFKISTDGQHWTSQAQMPAPLASGIKWECGSWTCLGEDGTIHIVGGDRFWHTAYYCKTGDLGETWSDPVVMIDTPDFFHLGGIGAYDGHVVIGGCLEAEEYPYYGTMMFICSHDNGDTWEAWSQLPIPVPDDWFDFTPWYAGGFWMDEERAYTVISGFLDSETWDSAPPPFTDAGTKDTSYMAYVEYASPGAPPTQPGSYLADGEGTHEGLISGTMAYDQEESYALQLHNIVPVKTYPDPWSDINPIREPPYDHHYWMKEIRAYYSDDGAFAHEVVWRGDYPGPHGYSPSFPGNSWDYNSWDEIDSVAARFSPWRSPPSGAGAFWW